MTNEHSILGKHSTRVIVKLTYKRNETSQDDGNALALETTLSKINLSTNNRIFKSWIS